MQYGQIPQALEVLNSGVKLTPMMVQFREVKQQFPETLVLFRMGDFYELFFEDAHRASQVLGIALTYRGKLGDIKIPMAGIPHHAAMSYLDRLTQAGLKAAICEQIEDPAQAKGIIKRALTQVISPGLPYDVDKSNQQEHHYIACVTQSHQRFFLALLDYTTGDFLGTVAQDEDELMEKLALYSPKEFLSYLGQWESCRQLKQFMAHREFLISHLSQDHFDEKVNVLYLKKLIGNYERDEIIQLNHEILPALAALSFYICSTQRLEKYHHIRPFRMEQEVGKLKIGLSTLKGIEIFPKSKETSKESLLGFFDRTKSFMGSRELKSMFMHPLNHEQKILWRHDSIQYFLDHEELLDDVRNQLSNVRDLERILVKLTKHKILGGDLLALARAIKIFDEIWEKLKMARQKDFSHEIFGEIDPSQRGPLVQLAQDIHQTINDEIGAHLEKGNLIRPGFDRERDRLQDLVENASVAIQGLAKKYRRQYEIGTLKIKYNNLFGHFIEISKGQADKAPDIFYKKQTLVNCERFSSDELQKLEVDIISAKDELQKLEKRIFERLLESVTQLSSSIMALSRTLGRLDVLSTFAWVALKEDLTRPQIVSDQQLLQVEKGWHPLIKANRQDLFVPHDMMLNQDSYFALITGPNMAGKTTVMREMAIIQFLAQVGSFVPAKSARLGICDYLFSRLGASDNIVHGQSTFMVEMSETASILRHATSKSFILLDEVGRGTSTYDGMSIAWSLVEFFVREVKAICLFSTHYHELIDLAHSLDGAVNLTVETVTKKGDVKFLYRLIQGGAQESFGLYVAKLAGLPQQVLKRSQEILEGLEQTSHKVSKGEDQLFFFDSSSTSQLSSPTSGPEIPPHLMRLKSHIAKLKVMEMTPLEALQKLHEIQGEL